MALRSFFRSQLATYVSYHRDKRNRATHFIGIPLIVFSILAALAHWDVSAATTAALPVMVVFWLLWIVLDFGVGLMMGLFLMPCWYLAQRIAYSVDPGWAWGIAAAAFVLGWVFQLWGHLYEGRRPALVDNLFQALIGPMFLAAEIMVALGLRPDLKPIMTEAEGK